MDGQLPKPITTPEFYMVAMLDQLKDLTAAVQSLAAAASRPDGTFDEEAFHKSLVKIKGIGDVTATEIIEKLKGL